MPVWKDHKRWNYASRSTHHREDSDSGEIMFESSAKDDLDGTDGNYWWATVHYPGLVTWALRLGTTSTGPEEV